MCYGHEIKMVILVNSTLWILFGNLEVQEEAIKIAVVFKMEYTGKCFCQKRNLVLLVYCLLIFLKITL